MPDSQRERVNSASNKQQLMQNANKSTSARKLANSTRKQLGVRPSLPSAGMSSSNAKRSANLSRPSEEYLRALADPFEGPLATIPDFPSLPSRRVRVWSKGFFSTGTSQLGFVCFDPYASAANDMDCVFSSDNTYAGTVSSVTVGAGVVASRSNSDYTASDYTAGTRGIQGRVVAAGIRIRYSSTELSRGGVVAGATAPNHFSVNNLSFSQINAFECSTRFRPQQKWMSALYCPVFASELNYSTALGSRGGLFSAYTSMPIMGFWVQAPDAASSVSFEYEAYCVFEVQGDLARSLVPSYSDPNGFAAALTTAQLTMMRPVDTALSTHGDRLVRAAGQIAAHTLTGVANNVGSSALKWIEGIGGSLLAGLLI